jgi:hypothetical protein
VKRNQKLLGAFVLSFLSTIVLGEEATSTPVSDHPTAIRVVDDQDSPFFGSIEFVLRLNVAERILSLTQQDLRSVFPVWVGENRQKLQVLGTYSADGSVVRFSPRYPLETNLDHIARIEFESLRRLLGLSGDPASDFEARIALRRERPEPTTVVSAIFPLGDVPENLLRFYLHFSAPMSRGGVYEHVFLIDSNGARVEKAFLELEPELWDSEAHRLTLLFDPGRIKRGLKPRSDLGSALRAGQHYSLVIGQSIEDAQGRPLAAPGAKAFTVQDVDRVSPNTNQWTTRLPKVGSRDSLVITLDESVDHALLHRMLSVVDGNEEYVSGEVFVGDGEKRWLFIPDDMWRAGAFSLQADVRLEDRAGNRLDRLFDQEIDDQKEGRASPGPFILVPFVVK